MTYVGGVAILAAVGSRAVATAWNVSGNTSSCSYKKCGVKKRPRSHAFRPQVQNTNHKVQADTIHLQNLPDSGVSVLGWCLMTNHVHLIAVPAPEDSLSVLFRRGPPGGGRQARRARRGG